MTTTGNTISVARSAIPPTPTPARATIASDGALFVRTGLFDTLYQQAKPAQHLADTATTERSPNQVSITTSGIVEPMTGNDTHHTAERTAENASTHQRMRQFQLRYGSAAAAAAATLGTTTNTVLAFAAHETGWGQHTPGHAGQESYNLFGIKARPGASPDDQVSSETTEVLAGHTLRLQQNFRRYASADDSVADFARFLIENPRYRPALATAAQPQAFIRAVHQAGYATDPNYATKVISVWERLQHLSQGTETPDQNWSYPGITTQTSPVTVPVTAAVHPARSGAITLYPSMLDLFSRYQHSLESASAVNTNKIAPVADRVMR